MTIRTIFFLVIAVSHVCQWSFAFDLDLGRFSNRNHAALCKLILKYGKNSPKYNPSRKSYIVCDWDNTSVFGDTEDTLIYYMLDNLAYTMNIDEFRRTISANVPHGASQLKNLDGSFIIFEDLINDLLDDYTYLYNNYLGRSPKNSLAEIKASEEYKDFVAKMHVMVDAIGATCGSSLACQWQGQILSGMTSERLMELSRKSIQANLGAELRRIHLFSSNKLKRRCKNVSSSTFQGLREYPDMANLYHSMMNNGIDVYVVSASLEEVVVPIACDRKYGYTIPRDHVFGVKLSKTNGVLQPELSPDRCMTWGKGKAELISKYLASNKGYGPIFVCGDSDGDYNMLTEFKDTKLSLIINRQLNKHISKLYEEAHKELSQASPRYIIQGIDENTGLFNPAETSIIREDVL